jgi:hypothetical protein
MEQTALDTTYIEIEPATGDERRGAGNPDLPTRHRPMTMTHRHPDRGRRQQVAP